MKYIIDFKDTVLQHEIDNHILSTTDTHNIRIIKHYKGFGNVFLVEADAKPELNELIESVVEDENNAIKLLGVDVVLTDSIETTTFNIDDTKDWWKVASINNLDFDKTINTHTIRGFNTTAYILDSGIEQNHPEFDGVNITLLHSFTDDFTDTKGHGTALASLISGKTCGLTGASLKIVKIFDVNKPTLQSDLLHAFDEVLADYAANGKKPSVVNLSWGISKNDYINDKVQVMIDQGMFVVAAAGNAGVPIGDVTPASIPNVLTVGSYDQDLKPCDFSNYTGDSMIGLNQQHINTGALDGWAPGSQIWAAGLNGTYGFIAGTSASAAIASGAIAYNLSRYTNDVGHAPGPLGNFNEIHETFIKNWKPTPTTPDPDGFTPFVGMAITRPNLLDLSDPKYSASYNRIVTYISRSENSMPNVSINITGGETVYRSVFSRSKTQRVVTTQTIPDYISVDERGIVCVVPPDITEPYLQLDPIEFDLYQRDGSIETTIIRITILRADITKDTAPSIIPADDPVLDIVLYNANCYSLCWDDCSGGYCGYAKPSCGCFISDIKTKKDIKLLDTIDSVGIYSFKYLWDKETTHVGVMAQNLIENNLDNLVKYNEETGYLSVNYALLPNTVKNVLVKYNSNFV